MEKMSEFFASMSREELIQEILKLRRNAKIQSSLDKLMIETRGNQAEAARILNTTRGSIRKYLKEKTLNVIVTKDDGSKVLLIPPYKSKDR